MTTATAPTVEFTPVHANLVKDGWTILTDDGPQVIEHVRTVSWCTTIRYANGRTVEHDGRDLLRVADDRTRLPYRYMVVHSFHADRWYLDDGSNFVTWLDGEDDPAAIPAAWDSVDRARERTRRYVETINALGGR